MVFNSATFLVFFLLFYGIYWLLNTRWNITFRNIFILFSSYLFYGWWDWRFLGLIVISSTSDYLLGQWIYRTSKRSLQKTLLICSLTINLGILGFFKYFNFFMESFVDLMSLFSFEIGKSTLNVILPVGISFYTFQTLSYTIDVYRGKMIPTWNPAAFFAYVAFFPQLVAGPIERAGRLLPQFLEKKKFSYDQNLAGLRLILWGLFKKVVIADNFGVLVDHFYTPAGLISGPEVLLGALFFGFQIYADFSGYSDIAIGIARMLGFDLMTNFRTPFFSRSIGEFWRRWHISLSTWFRDYVYIPLGGNRKNEVRVAVNLMVTFLLSGLWHGAGYTYLIWAGLHGLGLILERLRPNGGKGIGQAILTFTVITLLWIVFRAENISHCSSMMQAVFNSSSYTLVDVGQIITEFSILRFFVLLLVLTGFIILEYKIGKSDFNEWIGVQKKGFQILLYYLLLFAILFVGNFTVKPDFIYFQF